ncbi:PAS domain S-box protein [Elusimicrobiota bacterium]
MKKNLKNQAVKTPIQINNIPVSIYIRKNKEMIDVNSAMCRSTGYKKQELINMSLTDLLHPDCRKGFRKLLSDKRAAADLNIKIITKTGKEKWFKVNEKSRKAGNSYLVTGSLSEITSEIQEKEELSVSETKFRALAETPDGITFIYNDRGEIVYINETSYRLTGYKVKEILGANIMSVIHPAYIDRVRNNMQKRLKGRPVTLTYEIKALTKNGKERWLRIHGKRIQHKDECMVLCHAYDITDRKNYEIALTEKEAQLRTALDSIPFDLFVIDRTGRYILQNSACVSSGGNIIGKTPRQVAPDKETYAIWRENNKKAFSGKVVKGEVEFTVKGRKRWFYNIIAPVRNGKIIEAILGVNIDISRQKQAEEALKISEDLHRTLIDTSPDPIVMIDMDGKIKMVNKAAVKLHEERSKRSMLGKSGFDYIKPQDRKRIGRSLRSFSRSISDTEIFNLVTSKGNEVPVELNSSMILDAEGRPSGFVGIFRDIRERYEAEQKLRESEGKFRNLAEQSPNMIFINQKGRLVYVNRRCEEIMGYSQKELYAEKFDFRVLVASEDLRIVEENFKKHLNGMEVESIEYTIVAKNNRRIPAILTTRLIEYKSDRAILGVITDISEKKKVEAELQQAQKLASIGQFAAGLAHEINNPLSALAGEIQWKLEKYSEKDRDISDSLIFMKDVTERISEIVNNLLVFSRQNTFDHKDLADFNHVVKNALNLTKTRLALNNIRVIKQLGEGLPLIKMGIAQIEQVILNITMNSFFAMEKTGGTLSVKTRWNKNSNNMELTIKDTGVGIRKEEISKIFEPFYTTRGPDKGTGLGLSVSHGIVSEHGGSINVSSHFGKGTTVVISLPVNK